MMPSTSLAQQRFMAAVAHGWKPDNADAPSRKVAREFNQADKKRGKKGLPERVKR